MEHPGAERLETAARERPAFPSAAGACLAHALPIAILRRRFAAVVAFIGLSMLV